MLTYVKCNGAQLVIDGRKCRSIFPSRGIA